MDAFILALDQGTTSSRAILFDSAAKALAVAQKEFPQIFPRPGWVEHDPLDIWESQLAVAREAIAKAKIDPGRIAAIGVANQRETVVFWERSSGRPLRNAIVWQCRRSAELCRELAEKGLGGGIREKTGLLLDPYFSASKIKWVFENEPELLAKARRGGLCVGTVDSWLLFKLTGGVHATDPSNASRTMLMDIRYGHWDDELLELFGIPPQCLPEIRPTKGFFGSTLKELLGASIPVGGMAGDQQAALFGQACFAPGQVKNTYGTGCFMLAHTGKKPSISEKRLLSTVAWDIGDGLEYALEGSVFIGGEVVKWLRDQMGVLANAMESETLAASVKDSGGVVFVPAFVGLGAPYWDPDARGAILGLTRGSNKAHIARAALESVAFQSKELLDALKAESGFEVESLKVDGGASRNSLLMQFQADLLGVPVERPAQTETTALGAAFLAGLHAGLWAGREDVSANWRPERRFLPNMDAGLRQSAMRRWNLAVNSIRSFKNPL
jgi:glycerol kinase